MASREGKMTVYWDACVWLSYADDTLASASDPDAERKLQGCKAVASSAKAGDLTIYTSDISIVEVCSVPAESTGEFAGIPKIFNLDYVVLTPVDRGVIKFARLLMTSGYSKLKPYDAVHLSSAIVNKVDEFHTFDGDLLMLDGQVGVDVGQKLKICEPNFDALPSPLFDLDTAKDTIG